MLPLPVYRRISHLHRRTLKFMGVPRFPRLGLKTLVVVFILYFIFTYFWSEEEGGPTYPVSSVYDEDHQKHVYSAEDHPFIFIGGHPRSGTTLMRALLDAHPSVRCGEETRMIPRILQMRENWYRSENELERLKQAGIDDDVVDAAVSAFILETIVRHGTPTKVLCNKDPLTLKSGAYMAKIFPRSKWIFMMRDGRAVIHSVVTRKVTITGYNLDDPRQCLQRWNTVVESMNEQCNEVGPRRCMIVYYEQLVLHPRRWLSIILDFLELPWDEAVMHHHDFINKDGEQGIRVSNKERSSDQIVKPINVEALTQWVGSYPEDLVAEMAQVAPMLSKFGYDPSLNPPNYGVPDGEVVNNTKEVQANRDFWEVRSKQLVALMEKRD